MAETSEPTQPEAPQASVLTSTASVNGERSSTTTSAAEAAGSSDAAGAEPAPPASADVAVPSAASEADASHAAEGEHAEAHDAEGGEEDGEEESTSAGEEAAAAPGEGGAAKKRKRRRRRKRKDGTSSGEVTAAGEGAEAQAPRPADGGKKKESHAPFAHLFTGAQGGKRHAFAVGEVVAGRVQRVEHGVIVVDLFGKATAIADEYEPREVPPLPAPVEPAAEHASEASATAEPQHAEAAPSDLATTLVGDAAPAHLETGVEAPAEPPLPPESPLPEQAALQVPPLTAAEPSASEPHVAHEPEAPAPVEHASTASGEMFAASDEDLDDDHEEETEPGAVEAPIERPEPPKIGQVFKGRVGAVSESGHVAILNRIIDGRAVREQLEHKRQEHKRVHGVVYGFNRGGFDVLVEGLRAFCPASAMALEDIGDPLEFVGRKLEFLLPASRAGSKDLIVSRRSILERLQRRKTKEFLRSLTPGQKFKGRVTAVRDFGLFVDIGGVEGLVHQSELSYAFGVKPSSIAKVGDEIDVQVLRVGGDAKRDSGKKERLTRVSLSVKALLPDPWDAHADALSEGNVHKGKVVRATEFGAFIEIVPEIEGLLHITELGRDLKHSNQAVKEGDEIYVVVDRVDRRARRISLSKLSAQEVQEFEAGSLTKDEAAARNLRQGSNVKVKVERIEPRVILARVTGTVGRRGRAFIPNSETGTERGTDLRKKFPVGSELEVKIIGIDRDGSLKCSVKALQIDEERQAVKNYRREAAKQGFGTFGDLLRAKLGEAQSK
jgi:small subunit ribosomal protein S1